MEISELRLTIGMSQRMFANYFGIPVGTLRNWEQGISKPPEYVLTMIFNSIGRDIMININTIKFMKRLDELAELSKYGIEEFDNATEETIDQKIFYDKDFENKIVMDACICDDPKCYHHDVISFFESSEYVANVEFSEDDNKPYIIVKLLACEEEIVIEDGRWYVV